MLPPMEPRLNIWFEVDGKVALSLWRIRLLQAVDRTGSISAAAEAMGVQYRLAWQRIHEMEERLGVSLVTATIGGRGGGGSTLTPLARRLIEHFLVMAEDIGDHTQQAYRQHFATFIKEDSQR